MKKIFFQTFLLLIFFTPSFGQKQLFKAIDAEDIKSISSYINKNGINCNTVIVKSLYDEVMGKNFKYAFDPLEYAAFSNKIGAVKYFLSNPESLPDFHESLNRAFSASISTKNKELIHLILEAGPDIDNICHHCYERTPVQISLENSDIELFNELVAKGASFECNDKMGRTLLHSAAAIGNISVAEQLLKAGLYIDAVDLDNITAVMYAASNGEYEMVSFFLEHDADLSIISNTGYDIMFFAVSSKNAKLVSYLIEKQVDPDSRDINDWSPLLLASYLNDTGMVKILVDAGAEINILSGDEETPLSEAIINKNIEMAEFLLERGIDVSMKDYRNLAKKYIKDKEFLRYLEVFYE